jgi:hypothetical protein
VIFKFGFRKWKFVLALSAILSIILQYGNFIFLDQQAQAELLAWQFFTLPYIFSFLFLTISMVVSIWFYFKGEKDV